MQTRSARSAGVEDSLRRRLSWTISFPSMKEVERWTWTTFRVYARSATIENPDVKLTEKHEDKCDDT